MARRQRAESKPAGTEYIVLEAVPLDAGARDALGIANSATTVLWAPVLNATSEQGEDGQPRVFSATSKEAAIRQHTGRGPDVLPGAWKAIPLSSWKGGERTERVTAEQRLPLDD